MSMARLASTRTSRARTTLSSDPSRMSATARSTSAHHSAWLNDGVSAKASGTAPAGTGGGSGVAPTVVIQAPSPSTPKTTAGTISDVGAAGSNWSAPRATRPQPGRPGGASASIISGAAGTAGPPG